MNEIKMQNVIEKRYPAIDTEKIALLSIAALWGSKTVTGQVKESSFRLRKRIGYRNSFQCFLTGSMRSAPGGTAINCSAAMHPFVKIFMTVWFCGVVCIGFIIFVSSLQGILSGSGQYARNAWLGIFFPFVMLAFGFGLVKLGRHFARDDARFLTDFLVRTLDAREQVASA